jgi:hypothetical protein
MSYTRWFLICLLIVLLLILLEWLTPGHLVRD